MNEKELSESLVFLPPKPDVIERNKVNRTKQIDIALIDPRALMRESFSDLLKTNTQDFTVHTFANIQQFLKNTTFLEGTSSNTLKNRLNDDYKCKLNLILINIDTQDVDADKAKKDVLELQNISPNIPLIVLADQEDTDHIAEAFRSGASGYIPTSLTPSIAIAALRLIIAGGRYIPEAVLREILEGRVPHLEQHLNSSFNPENLDNLTERQQEVLNLLRQGKSNKLIAYEIGVQESTVKVHVREIMKKLHATNRTHAAYIAERILPE
ncbi:MAG: response regulator transcription factor [Methylococcales bacterium]